MTKREIATMIANRDNISLDEAYTAIDDTIAAIEDETKMYDSPFYAYEIATEILSSELGLEPDYLIDLLY